MSAPAAWNPLTDWKRTDIDWIKVDISKEDLRRFTKRSNVKGFCQAVGFLLLIATTGGLSYLAFSSGHWILMAVALYIHGTCYSHFGDALHELGHNTVFTNQSLNRAVMTLYGWLYWPWNPYLYRLSHQGYHHPQTLYQGSDGEDTPNYVELTPRFVLGLFLTVVEPWQLLTNLTRLFTLKPTSKVWRGRGFRLDTWEQFILREASETHLLLSCKLPATALA